VDSEVLAGLLEQRGYPLTESAEEAKVAIVNTCAFIEDSKNESLESILQLAQMKKEGHLKVLLVAGCLAQRYWKDLLDEIDEIDGVFGTSDFNMIPALIGSFPREGKNSFISSSPDYLYDHTSPRKIMAGGHYTYFKIQEGCSNRCSYCVIPDLRGALRSRTVSSVVKEVKRAMARMNVREFILIGQDTTSFGSGDPAGADLADLISRLSDVLGDEHWIRLLYTHPAHFSDRLISVISSRGNVCNYVDLPLQHINTQILKKMNRKVDRNGVIGLLDKIRMKISPVAVRTSFIVGFPGETDEAFRELSCFIQEQRFERLGLFKYSREEGTPAASFPGQISEKVKQRRFDTVMSLQQDISKEINSGLMGTEMKVIIDEKVENEPGLYMGRSFMDAPEVDGIVYVRSEKEELFPGDFRNINVTGFMEYDLVGDIE
jgi:ribosomal protein S12 methylthiotransferase